MNSASENHTDWLFQGPGQMRSLCRTFDWSLTRLGSISRWPQSLRTAVQIALASPFPHIVMWGPDLIQIYNDGYRDLMGNKHPGGLGQPTQQCWPEVWHINQPIYQRVWAGESFSFDNALYPITRSGQLKDAWFTLAYSPVLDESGQVGGILVTVFDTTDQVLGQRHRLQTQQALHESEQRFSLLVRATSEMVYTMTGDWKQMLRMDGKDYLMNNLTPNSNWLEQYIPATDRVAVWAAIQRAIELQIPFEAEHQVFGQNGSIGWVSSRAIPILDEEGQIQYWLGAASDVTERKQVEEALKQADQRKDEFLAMLGHELRNPLATLSNILLLLELTNGGDETLPYPKAVEVMSREVGNMTHMVDDLLDVGRIRYGLIQLHKMRIDLRAIVDQTVEVAQLLYQEQERQLSVSLPSFPVFLMGDGTRLSQVLMNLLTNGLKYTQPAGHVWVSLELVDNTITSRQALLRVKDDGIGIAPDQREAIFDIFVQGQTTLDRPQGGLGLGLAVVKQLVTLHGGRVEVRSGEVGQGSEFLIWLPLIAEPLKSPLMVRPIHDLPDGKGRVLVIDDNQTLADMTARLVELIGYEVQASYSGADALVVAEQWRPDVVLLDLGMPQMDGFEVNRRLRAQPWAEGMAIIAVTGYGQQSFSERTGQAGFTAYLLKPINLPRLREVLTTIMTRSNLES